MTAAVPMARGGARGEGGGEGGEGGGLGTLAGGEAGGEAGDEGGGGGIEGGGKGGGEFGGSFSLVHMGGESSTGGIPSRPVAFARTAVRPAPMTLLAAPAVSASVSACCAASSVPASRPTSTTAPGAALAAASSCDWNSSSSCASCTEIWIPACSAGGATSLSCTAPVDASSVSSSVHPPVAAAEAIIAKMASANLLASEKVAVPPSKLPTLDSSAVLETRSRGTGTMNSARRSGVAPSSRRRSACRRADWSCRFDSAIRRRWMTRNVLMTTRQASPSSSSPHPRTASSAPWKESVASATIISSETDTDA